jgi:hypothetical protein
LPAFCGLAVDNSKAAFSCPARLLSDFLVERVTDVIQGAVLLPTFEVKLAVLSAGRSRGTSPIGSLLKEHKKHHSNSSNVNAAPTPATLARRYHRPNHQLFGIRQVARIPQTMPISRYPVCRLPRLKPSTNRSLTQPNQKQFTFFKKFLEQH